MRLAAHTLCGLLLTVPVPTAAPVPAPPARLTPDLVAGRWAVTEGGWCGEMVFDGSGHYCWYSAGGGGRVGRWWVTARGTLRLDEVLDDGVTVSPWVYAGFGLRGSPRRLAATAWPAAEPGTYPGRPVTMTRLPDSDHQR